MDQFTQLCVWEGTSMGSSTAEEFEAFILNQFNTRVKFAEEVTTLPSLDESGNAIPDTGGRTDLFFYAHSDDLGGFAIQRLQAGIRWWEDVIGNGSGVLYTEEILEKYPTTW